jgi:hypothetical protein
MAVFSSELYPSAGFSDCVLYFWGNIGASCLSALFFIVWSFYKSGLQEMFSSVENISGLLFGSIGIAIATFIILWFVWIGMWGNDMDELLLVCSSSY